jgi:hypothetical protein
MGQRMQLKFVFLEGLERRRAAAQRVVFRDPVKDVNAAVVQQCRLGDRAFGLGRADGTLLQGPIADLLDGLKAVAFGAFVFVKRHGRSL